MTELDEPTPPPGAQPAIEYATPPRAEPSRAVWVIVAAITLTACALTFGIVYWWMDRPPRQSRGRLWAPVPLATQPAPFPQFTPGMNPPPQASLTPGRAELARCATHLQHVGAALQAWANRHDWRLPNRLEELVDAGLLDRGDLVCPAGEAFADAAPYLYVGRGLTTPVAADVVVVYEPPVHVGGLGMNVLFGDGGVRLLTGDDARRVLAEARAGRGPLHYSPTTAPAAEGS